MKTTLIWTSLPNGVATNPSGGTPLRLSVLVSPRLDPEGPSTTLGAFNLGNFTSWVQDLSMSFAFGSPGSSITLPATLVNTGPSALDPSLWPLVFPPTTPVRGYTYDTLTAKRLHSFPVRDVVAYLGELYGTLAKTSPGAFPAAGTANPNMSTLLTALGGIRQKMPELEQKFAGSPSDDQILQVLGVPNDAQHGAPALAFYKAYRFYRRRVLAGPASPDRQPPDVPDPEFHEMVAIMSDYPVLLRKLGLILDYEVNASLSSLPADSFVRASPITAVGAPVGGKRPLTAYLLTAADQQFLPKPRAGSDISRGVLQLSDPERFTVSQVDVDGSALKVVEFAGNLTRLATQWPQAAPAQEPVPALRTGGFAVSQVDRASRLSASFPVQDTLNAAIDAADPDAVEQTPLYADDVARGVRPDVEVGGAWYSLCRRVGQYRVATHSTPIHLGPVKDEGYVKGASVSGEADLADDLYAHEAVFGWDGWSLAAPRPGRTISFEKDPGDPRYQTTTVAQADNTPVTKLDVQVDFQAEPGSLPRLRFGQAYRFRARVVDLAGNSHSLQLPTPQSMPTATHRYLRYEPIQQPALVHRTRVTEGESMEHLVIRSNRGVGVSSYVSQGDMASYGYPETCERHVAPPKVSQGMAEAHGSFDAIWSSEDASTRALSYRVGLKEAGTLLDREVFDIGQGAYVPVAGIELVSTASTPPERVGKWPDQRGDGLAAGQYVMHTGATLKLPYLPDPLVVGVTLEDPSTGAVYQRSFAGNWPEAEPFRVVVREGSEVDVEPRVEVEGGTVDVFLPKAAIFKLRYSCHTDPSGLATMAWFQGLQGEALSRARAGTHWMLTPQREMTLVHAVQQPLQDPVAEVETDAERTTGQTFTILRGQVLCHGASTGRVDVLAHWVDPVDLVTDPGPSKVGQRAHIAELTPAYGQDTLPLSAGTYRHELGDTKHRNVVYQAIGTTRFREYFPVEVWKDKARITSTEQVAAPGTLGDNEPQFTKLAVSVLSTTRPDAPKVLYAVPTFLWDTSGGGKRRSRRGNGVRVYLDRPWYSSGDGELLAATVAPAGANANTIERFVSEWGSDPVRRNPAPQNRLGLGHFRGSKRTGKGLTLADGPSVVVDVAGFEPQYHEERQLWFCDIQLDAGDAYMPFVRLALARYQPESLPGLELSRLVRAEFLQLAPDRSAVVSRTAPGTVSVALSGVTGDNEDGEPQVPEVGSPQDIASPPAPSDGFDLAAPDLAPDPSKAQHHMVRARLELKLGSTDLDWRPLDQGVELPAYHKGSAPGTVVWRGNLPLPQAAQQSPGSWRIAVLEYEVLPTDPDVAQTGPTVKKLSSHVASRLVFAGHLEIPS